MEISNKKNIILFIDDEKICHSLADLIIPNFTEFKLVGAYNGEEAMTLGKRYSSELCLVLCDIMLPDINGYEILAEFKKDPKLQNIPFVFQSGVPTQELAVRNEFCENTNIISKPYKQEDLLRVIYSAVAS
jgi:response regulator RpfG family c-di-GMP phosphodiesterase